MYPTIAMIQEKSGNVISVFLKWRHLLMVANEAMC